MFAANSSSTRLRLAVALAGALFCASIPAIPKMLPGAGLRAQFSAADGASEFEETLFLQSPHLKNAQGAEVHGVLSVVSVPEPIQKYCMGKTEQQCATIDFCIRTTTKTVAMCQSLPAGLRHLPPYPAGMRPNRVYSISFFQKAPSIPGFEGLRQYFDHAPPGSLDTFSEGASFQARVRFTRTATDGSFQLLEVLSTPVQ